jgi:hypothetical protein
MMEQGGALGLGASKGGALNLGQSPTRYTAQLAQTGDAAPFRGHTA